MWKHFQLSKLVNQGNNFVIYEEFFDNTCKNIKCFISLFLLLLIIKFNL